MLRYKGCEIKYQWQTDLHMRERNAIRAVSFDEISSPSLVHRQWLCLYLISFPLLFSSSLFKGSIPAAPENITVTFISPTSVRVSWQQPMDVAYPIEKYDVTYKPTDAR
jgi:hypothetical protein